MNKREKHAIIMREIRHWRRHKLLPEQYCDFLLNLYREEAADHATAGRGIRFLFDRKWGTGAAVAFVIVILPVVALSFQAFSMPVQAFLAGAAIAVLYFWGIIVRHSLPSVAVMLTGSASALLLAAGSYLIHRLGVQDRHAAGAFVLFCGLLWAVVGIRWRLRWLSFCGWACAGLAVLFLFWSVFAG